MGSSWNAGKRVRDEMARRFPDWAARLGPDHVIDIASFGAIGDTALTSGAEIEMLASGLPSTFVPGRNLVFFVYARGARLPARAHHAGRRHVRDRLLRLSRLPRCDLAGAGAGDQARHRDPLRDRDAADVADQGRHLGAGRSSSAATPWSISSSRRPTAAIAASAAPATNGAMAAAPAPLASSAPRALPPGTPLRPARLGASVVKNRVRCD